MQRAGTLAIVRSLWDSLMAVAHRLQKSTDKVTAGGQGTSPQAPSFAEVLSAKAAAAVLAVSTAATAVVIGVVPPARDAVNWLFEPQYLLSDPETEEITSSDFQGTWHLNQWTQRDKKGLFAYVPEPQTWTVRRESSCEKNCNYRVTAVPAEVSELVLRPDSNGRYTAINDFVVDCVEHEGNRSVVAKDAYDVRHTLEIQQTPASQNSALLMEVTLTRTAVPNTAAPADRCGAERGEWTTIARPDRQQA